MLIKDVAKKIQDDLNTIADTLGYTDVVFNLTDNIQRYETDMKNYDDEKYTPGVVKQNGAPFLFNSLDIESRDYEITIYGWAKQRPVVEKIFDEYKKDGNTSTGIGDNKIFLYSSGLIIDKFGNSTDGLNSKRFEAIVDINVQILPYTLDGSSVSVKVDGVSIPFKVIQYRKDKSVIQNIPYASNNSNINMVSDTFVLELPATLNSKIQELLGNVLDATYNKKYVVEWTLGTIVKTFDVIMRTGNITLINNSNPITFSATFELALPRNTIQINGQQFEILKKTFNADKIPTTFPRQFGEQFIMKNVPLRYQNSMDLIIVLPPFNEIILPLVFTTSDGGATATFGTFTNMAQLQGIIPNNSDATIEIRVNSSNESAWQFINVRRDGILLEFKNLNYHFFVSLSPASTVKGSDGIIPIGNVDFKLPQNQKLVVIQKIIDEIKTNNQDTIFDVIETKFGKTYNHQFIIANGSYDDGENPDLFIKVTFVEYDGGDA